VFLRSLTIFSPSHDAAAWVKKYSEIEAAKAPAPLSAAGDDSAVRKNVFQRFFPGKKEDGEDGTCEEETAIAGTATAQTNVAVVRKIGITRYALVFSGLLLILYNIHLWFSQ